MRVLYQLLDISELAFRNGRICRFYQVLNLSRVFEIYVPDGIGINLSITHKNGTTCARDEFPPKVRWAKAGRALKM